MYQFRKNIQTQQSYRFSRLPSFPIHYVPNNVSLHPGAKDSFFAALRQALGLDFARDMQAREQRLQQGDILLDELARRLAEHMRDPRR
jgi:hypothetical protein